MTRLCLHVLSFLIVGALSEPIPGRIPKVYNALITSNQNLEPSKAFPVYQPVLHDTFGFPYQPTIFYGGDFPLSNGLLPVPPVALPGAKDPKAALPPVAAPGDTPAEAKPESPPADPSPSPAPSEDNGENKPTPAPLSPPNTPSPIPLNQFGLPSQVIPLGPAFDGFSQVGPFTYSYPGLRFYDPFDPFSLSPYSSLPPLYRPLTNVLSPGQPGPIAPPKAAVPQPAPAPSEATDGSTPPPEPSDLNVLNYSSKDPAIPNVPPPPLPSGGLTSDKSE